MFRTCYLVLSLDRNYNNWTKQGDGLSIFCLPRAFITFSRQTKYSISQWAWNRKEENVRLRNQRLTRWCCPWGSTNPCVGAGWRKQGWGSLLIQRQSYLTVINSKLLWQHRLCGALLRFHFPFFIPVHTHSGAQYTNQSVHVQLKKRKHFIDKYTKMWIFWGALTRTRVWRLQP